jgi:hypothetical protein
MLPSNELLASQSSCSTTRYPIPSGISPDNWFPLIYKKLRFFKLPTSEGRDPDSKLYDRSIFDETNSDLKISMGIEPFRQFLDRSSCNRFSIFPKLSGIGPSRLASYVHQMKSVL